MAKNILAVDIGGTNSRFSHFQVDEGAQPRQVQSTWLSTSEADSFPTLLRQLGESDFGLALSDVDYAVFAVAGPIERGVFCSPPNIAWDIDLSNSVSDFSIERFSLINDFLAQGYCCLSPLADSAEQILDGTRVAGATIAVVGAGTGLGKAALVPDGFGSYVGCSSEGGHVNIGCESAREYEFSQFVGEELGGYATWNDVVSGKGLSFIHQFLTGEKLSPAEVAQTFNEQSETLEWAARFYGRVCRNYALETLAMGGLFIAGGVAAKNPLLIKHAAFADSFRKSRQHEELLAGIPVFLIDNQESGLWGAAYLGWRQLSNQ